MWSHDKRFIFFTSRLRPVEVKDSNFFNSPFLAVTPYVYTYYLCAQFISTWSLVSTAEACPAVRAQLHAYYACTAVPC